ncbi:MAG: VCBS repeat-containing protein, partial [Bacteroidota bacterium]
MIASNGGEDQIVYFRNDGLGVFSDAIAIGEVQYVRSLFSADLDGDGDMDIAVGGSDVFWFENDGNGNFMAGYELDDVTCFSINGGDFDGDGDIDLICAKDAASPDISLFENLGGGNFSQEITLASVVGDGESVYPADLDLDGDLDIVYASHSTWGTFSFGVTVPEDSTVGWIENLGNGDFSDEKPIASDVANVSDVHLADLNSDGHLDILAALWQEEQAIWYKNLGDGNYQIQEPFSNNLWRASDINAADLDSDGDMDVVCVAAGDGILRWYENEGADEFSSNFLVTLSRLYDTQLGDIDNDGDIDILSYRGRSSNGTPDGSLGWHENDGNGNFATRQVLVFLDQTVNYGMADMDSDGDLDIIEDLNGEIHWNQNNGNGDFSTLFTIAAATTDIWDIEVVDFDADGDIDVLASRPYENKLSWYENDGLGNFSAEIVISESLTEAEDFKLGDLDLDGDLDVVLAIDGSIAWVENQGGQMFGAPIIFHEGTFDELQLGDLDQNGYLDVVWNNNLSDQIVWHKNNGLGCMDVNACNYDPLAQIDSGNCCYDDCGCTNPVALNYDASAVCENYSCEFLEGCTNQLASNFNPDAIVEDSSCLFEISGQVFYDENENGVLDGVDYGLPFQSVSVDPLGIIVITDDQGFFSFNTLDGQLLTVSVADNPLYPFNITPHPVQVNPEILSNTFIEFGLSTEAQDFGICVDLYPTGNTFLCNVLANHNICFRNMGNVPIDGVVELEYDPLFQGHEQVTPIDSVDANVVYMSFENLLPGEM